MNTGRINMKALMLTDVRQLALQEVPVAPVGSRGVKIRVTVCGLCGTDHSVYAGSLVLPGEFPFYMGHELSGTVEEVGKEVQDIAVGDLVVTNPVRYCGDCDMCRGGKQHYCQRLAELWEPNGGFSEYVVADRQQVFVAPKGLTPEQAAFAEPVSVCLHCIDMADIKPGMSVAITGAGPIGLILLQLAIRAGAAFTFVSEPVEKKRQLAKQLGADVVVDPKTEDVVARAFAVTDNRVFDVVIEASGSESAARDAFAITGMKSTLFYFAVYPMDFTLPLSPFILYTKELTIRGVFFSPYTFPRTLALLPRLELDPLISHRIPLEDAATAFEIHESGEAVKIMVMCG
jgi:(R,R)-butanediol dehydrogenase/meso-butanediol dehydrogenase/diacetyl reductase/L-iditol 2-dehydrogenase